MNHISIKQMIIVYGVIVLLVALIGLTPELLVSAEHDTFEVPATSFHDGESDLTLRLKTPEEPVNRTFVAYIPKSAVEALPDDAIGLSITRLEGQGYRVKWNDTYIGYAGDPDNGRANIWNGSHWFMIPHDEVKAQNTLALEIHAEYDMGARKDSIQLSTVSDAKRIAFLHSISTTVFTLIGIGIVFFAAILSFGLMVIKTRSKRIVVAMTAGLIFLLIYSLDFLNTDFIFMSYLTFKKIIISAAFIAILFFGLGSTWLLNNRIPFHGALASLVVYSIGMAMAQDMLTFRYFYNFATVLLPLNLVAWLFVIVPKMKTSDEARLLFGGIIITGASGMLEAMALLFNPNNLAMSSLSMILVVTALITFLIALDKVQVDTMLIEEQYHNINLLNKTKLDELSGLYNKSHFMTILKSKKPPYSVAMCDIDDFKKINDKYGHIFGDIAIRHAADIIKHELREGDIIARYGGDEYVAIVSCSSSMATAIFERVRKGIMATPLEKDGMNAKMTVSIGIYHVRGAETAESVLSKADKALYLAKKTGKNRTTVFQNGND